MSKNFYSGNLRTEPNMRSEFDAIMDGKYPEIPKAQTHVLRKMRRSQSDSVISDSQLAIKFLKRTQLLDYFVPEEGYLIPCPCVSEVSGEPDVDHYCPICGGEMFLWDEEFFDCYRVNPSGDIGLSTNEDLVVPGLTNVPLMIFYTRSSVKITRADKLVEIWTDVEGKPIRPYRRKILYRITTVIDFRSDNGKLEYWKLSCFGEHRKFLNGPGGF